MPQIMLDIPQYGPWLLTHKGDRACLQLADRQVGAPMFCRPSGNNQNVEM
jgi:DNA mismatch repair protein MutH